MAPMPNSSDCTMVSVSMRLQQQQQQQDNSSDDDVQVGHDVISLLESD